MVLPGWNVSEPIDLAYRLYEVVESLRSAPDSAKAFVSKINNFSANLGELQKILESDAPSHSAQDLKHLRATVIECQACVKRCEEFSEGFGKLTTDGKGKIYIAGQAARWTLQEKKVARLKEEIDGLINAVGLTLLVKTFADGRARQRSELATESIDPLARTGTSPNLPPYSSPRPNWAPTEGRQNAKTPSDILGLDITHRRISSDTETPNFHLETKDVDGKRVSMSPPVSPNTLRPLIEEAGSSDSTWEGNMKTSERRLLVVDKTPVSPCGLGISSAMSESSSPGSRVLTSPTISSRRTSTTGITSSASRPDSVISLDSAALEMIMENLDGVQASYYKTKSRISYSVSKIESFRNRQTGRRYIIISPPISSNIKLFFVLPTDRIIPHSEHPQAYGSTTKYRVKFIEPYLLRSQKTSSDRQPSDASSVLSPSLTPVSSAASVASSSLGSPILTTNSGVLREESRRQEYDFKSIEDYRKFQELLMGPNVNLQFQIPFQSITAKKYEESKPSKESQLQYLRLWQSNGRQTLMFFANLSANQYREYNMENFRPVETKSKMTIKLDVHLPGMVRRRSGSKSPLIIAKPSLQEQTHLSQNIDGNDMSDLNYLLIEFGYAQDRSAFLHEAKFHASAEEPTASPSASFSRSPP